jgi:TPR repeat protein
LAFEYFKTAAELNFVDGMMSLSNAYKYGDGVEPNEVYIFTIIIARLRIG